MNTESSRSPQNAAKKNTSNSFLATGATTATQQMYASTNSKQVGQKLLAPPNLSQYKVKN